MLSMSQFYWYIVHSWTSWDWNRQVHHNPSLRKVHYFLFCFFTGLHTMKLRRNLKFPPKSILGMQIDESLRKNSKCSRKFSILLKRNSNCLYTRTYEISWSNSFNPMINWVDYLHKTESILFTSTKYVDRYPGIWRVPVIIRKLKSNMEM